MAEYNEIEDVVIPDSPKVLPGEQNHIYVPIATYDQKGIARFDSRFFEVVDGKVILKTEFLDLKADIVDGKIPLHQLPVATNDTGGVASFDSEVFVVIDGRVCISEEYFEKYNEIIYIDDATNLPTKGRNDTLLVASDTLYYWNGLNYTPVKTIQSIEIAGISKGHVDNSLVFFDGEAYGVYSLASGSGSKALTDNSYATGIDCIAGVKCYYWHSFNVNAKTITLSTKRRSSAVEVPIWNVENFDWEIGDYVSIVNDAKYTFCSKIIAISNNTITVDSLPFSVDAYVNYDYGESEDERTIFAVNRTIDAQGCVNIVMRNGTVILGKSSDVIGMLNIGAGSFTYVRGLRNIACFDYGAVFGDDNLIGYASIGGGTKNFVPGRYCFFNAKNADITGDFNFANGETFNITGHSNNVTGKNQVVSASYSDVAGRFNTVRGDYDAVFGYANNVRSPYATVGGAFHNIPEGYNDISAFGRSVDVVGAMNLTGSKPLFLLGNGTQNSPSNAFIVTMDGRVYAGNKQLAFVEDLQGTSLGSITKIFEGGVGVGTSVNLGPDVINAIYVIADFYDDDSGIWQSFLVKNDGTEQCLIFTNNPWGAELCVISCRCSGWHPDQADRYFSMFYKTDTNSSNIYLRSIYAIG